METHQYHRNVDVEEKYTNITETQMQSRNIPTLQKYRCKAKIYQYFRNADAEYKYTNKRGHINSIDQIGINVKRKYTDITNQANVEQRHINFTDEISADIGKRYTNIINQASKKEIYQYKKLDNEKYTTNKDNDDSYNDDKNGRKKMKTRKWENNKKARRLILG